MSALDPLLLIGGASLPAGRDCLDQADARGIPVWLADTAANLARLPQLAERAVRVFDLPYHVPDIWVTWARSQRGRQEFLGVYGFRERAVQSVAAASEVLGTAGIGLATARRLQDKATCRQALRECGFRQPPSARCRNRDEALCFMATHKPGPWILKPPAAQGSVGISLLDCPEDLDPALTHLASSCADFARDVDGNQDHRAASAEPATAFLMEGFQTGTEYSVEGVCIDGCPRVLVVTEKLTTGPPHFVEIGHSMPADLGRVLQQVVDDTVCGALTALGLTWGVFHVELWIDGHEVVLGEVHARPGGDHIHTMTQHVTGLELHGAVFDQFLGRHPAAARPAWLLPSAAIRFLTPAPGRITRVTGWEKVLADPRILTGHCDLTVGGVVRPLTSYLGRKSYVVTTGPTRQAAVDSAVELCTTVRVETDTCPSPGAPDHLATLRLDLPAVTAGGYFNSGYTGPLCRAAHQAALATAEREYWVSRMGGHARTERERIHADARASAAALLGAGPGEIALTHHTTDGMNLVAHGLPWQPGDNAVSTRVEHKGAILPLGVLRERHGVEVRAVAWSPGEPLKDLPHRIAEAVDARTRLVVVSHVSYVDGGVLDLAPIVTAARRHGALVAVDGAQSAGVLPIDVTALDVDAYAISGQKWLCGPEGTGALYVHPRCLDRIGQTVVGWASVDTWELDGHFAPNADATRYEVGTRNLPQIAGFAAAVSWLRTRVGLPWAAARTAALAEQARERLSRVTGFTVLTPEQHSGLVALHTPLPAEELVRRMTDRGFTVRSIQGYDCVRASIGFFHTVEEVAALTEALTNSAGA